MHEKMKRRTFLAGLGALAAAPILPPVVPVAVEPMLAAGAVTGTSVAMLGSNVFWLAADGMMYWHGPAGELEELSLTNTAL